VKESTAGALIHAKFLPIGAWVGYGTPKTVIFYEIQEYKGVYSLRDSYEVYRVCGQFRMVDSFIFGFAQGVHRL